MVGRFNGVVGKLDDGVDVIDDVECVFGITPA